VTTDRGPDENRQKPTLTGPQETALTALVSGATVTEAAQRANVARPTVSEWVHHDPLFQAELRNRRAELWAAARAKLEAAGLRAVQTLTDLLGEEEPRVRLAAASRILAVLAMEAPEPRETTPQAVAQEWRRAESLGSLIAGLEA
jgi:hypothetical protein